MNFALTPEDGIWLQNIILLKNSSTLRAVPSHCFSVLDSDLNELTWLIMDLL